MALTRPKYNNLNSNVVVFNDPITVLNGGSTTDDDVGFLVNRANGLVPNVAIYWSEATNSFVTALTPDTGGPNANIDIASYANITTGNVYAQGYFYANGTPFISGGTSTYGNANVAAYLPTYNGNIGGNITIGANLYVGGNLIVSGNVYSHDTEILTQTQVIAHEVYSNSYFWANGVSFNYGNVQVAAYLPINPTITGIQANIGAYQIYANANAASQSNDIGTLYSNAASQQSSINLLTSSVTLATNDITALFSNAASQANDLTTLYANAASQQTQINSLATGANANTAAYLTTATGDIHAGNLTLTGNLSVQGNILSGTIIPASANQIYVAKNGSDTNNGTLNAPFLTIKAALAAAASGTSVQIAPGTYTENNPIRIPDNVSLMGDNLRSVSVVPQNPNSDLFYTGGGCYVWGITIKNYNANGFAYSSTQSANTYYVSPYIQNITSSTTSPRATAVMVDGNFTSASSTKGMIVGFFTIINQAGVGVHLTNLAYSQLVNIYTIGANVGIWSESGAFCTLNGSDNSIGNIGLRADGTGPLQSYGLTTGYSTAGSFTISNPSTPPHVNQVVVIQGDSSFYTIDTISKLDAVTYKVNVLETYTGNLAPGSNITFYQRSEVVASAHTFEYVGAGTNPATALPQYGGYPNANLNVVMTGGGRVSYTATDEKGNFYIGSNLIVNQATSTITGDAFNKSLFSQMTPYILALSEGP
jgi:hypothetical protein